MRPAQIFAFILAIGTSINSSAQSCEPYFPMKQGSEFEMTNYNSKDKISGKAIHKVKSRSVKGNDMECIIHMETFDKKDEMVSANEYKVICTNGKFKFDMKMLMDSEAMASYENMDVSVDADFIEIPTNPIPGEHLEDGTMVIDVESSGATIMTMTVKIFNRKVQVLEKITTPAGTFDCVKISFDTETRFIFKISGSVTEWYCKDVGMVKSESYDKKGKLIGHSLLTRIN